MKRFNLIEQDVNGEKVELIEFYDEHVYKIGDKYLPSISKKLGIIDKGYGFHQWEKQVGMNADLIMRQASDAGNRVHNAIELALRGNEVYADDPVFDFQRQDWFKFCQWAEWWDHYGFEPVFIEQIVYDLELGTAGKLDCIAKRGDEIYVMDWKTGGIYDSYYEQVLFYRNAAIKLGLIDVSAKACLVNVGTSHKKVDEKKLQGVGIGTYIVDENQTKPLLESSIKAWDLRNVDWAPPTLVYPRSVKVKNILKEEEK